MINRRFIIHSHMKILLVLLLLSSSVMAIVALFLNLVAQPGFSSPAEQSLLQSLRSENSAQLNASQILLGVLAPINQTDYMDTNRLRELQDCEAYTRSSLPGLVNATSTRLMELLSLSFNETVQLLLNNLALAQAELNALGQTGTITVHQTGKVDANMNVMLDYQIRSIKLGELGDELFYIEIPSSGNLLMTMMNATDTITLGGWVPTLGNSIGLSNFSRVDIIMDRQQDKVLSAPNQIRLQSRDYPSGTDIRLRGLNALSAGHYIGVADALHIGF